jgi:hypothetical protein
MGAEAMLRYDFKTKAFCFYPKKHLMLFADGIFYNAK